MGFQVSGSSELYLALHEARFMARPIKPGWRRRRSGDRNGCKNHRVSVVRPSGVIISAESPTFKDSDRAVVGAPFMRADADGRAVGDWQL